MKFIIMCPKEYGLYATKDIGKHEIIYDFSNSKTNTYNTQHASEIDEGEYIVYDDDAWSFHNHSFVSSTFHDLNKLQAFPLRPI